MANPPAAPGYGKRSSSKARKREADRQEASSSKARKREASSSIQQQSQGAGSIQQHPAARTGSPAINHPTDRARVLVSCARVLVE